MNRVTLIGRLTTEPKVSETETTTVLNMVIAVRRPTKDDKADFPLITVFGKLANHCAEHLQKGSLIGVDGKLQTSRYEDETGHMTYRCNVVANKIDFLSWGEPRDEDEADSE
ncbi:single-stranded DNA-binding protein [Zhenpiania hominis]|uniref:Single-stranded DNA-binding protein n=1 Tax=Zhenpiania hominis TaxID=2763644 RepID=A0A923NM65_9FIRM|nr:single-stranded DNA-binding protein [Zhenpiania hominis]MBC6679549.1 single-stranded DNA-binding protein [Zhenpiania hominis]